MGYFMLKVLKLHHNVNIYCNDYANTEINFQSNNDNIFDVVEIVSTTNKFIPQSVTQYALSPKKVSLNNISKFYISVDIAKLIYSKWIKK